MRAVISTRPAMALYRYLEYHLGWINAEFQPWANGDAPLAVSACARSSSAGLERADWRRALRRRRPRTDPELHHPR